MWKPLASLFVAQTALLRQSDDLSPVLSRLQNLRPTLDRIRQISGTAGASIGVIHDGHVIYKDNWGIVTLRLKLHPTHRPWSLTKSLTAIGIANLVHEGVLSWDTPVKDILPDFHHKDPCLTNLTTVVDLLAHRTGLTGDISLTFQGDGEALLPADQLLPTFSQNLQVAPFRSRWVYSSWGYSIAGLIIEKLSGGSLDTYLQKHVYDRFMMERTTTQISHLNDENIAEPYATDSKAMPVHLQSGMIFENTLFEAAAGAYSSVDDMLNYSKSLLEAYSSDHAPDELNALLSGHIPILGPSFRERSYAMGWIRTQLPGVLGVMGENIGILGSVEELPLLGKESPSMLCFYHQGSTAGYYSNIALFPETKSAIVVLANSIPLTDFPDTATQSIAQVLFDFPDPVDFVEFTKDVSVKLIGQYKQQAAAISARRRLDTRKLPLEEYTGRYWNELKNFVLDIRVGADSDTLDLFSKAMSVNDEDIFEWSLSLDEEAERGRYHIPDVDYFLIHFQSDQGKVGQLGWADYSFQKSCG
ncbi:Protein flp [Penicillium herquei]|nr:Protein flp [Penicillium herquei]